VQFVSNQLLLNHLENREKVKQHPSKFAAPEKRHGQLFNAQNQFQFFNFQYF
jgi:hypothetical protein